MAAKFIKGSLLILTHGAYSGFGFSGPFYVLKDVDLKEQEKLYRDVWSGLSEGEKDYVDKPQYDGFVGFLVKQGFIEDAESFEVHIGDYGDLEVE